MPWARGKSPLSLPLTIVLATFARILAFEEVARLFSVHWNTVRAAVKSAVDYGLEHRDTTSVIAIGIDEISRRKGHKYMTMVYDLTRARLLWCGEGRDKEALKSFFSEWGEERLKAIRAVCLDMWQPYIDVIEELLPQAVMVFDKFHIIRHLMDAVDQVRREEARELKETDPELLKKTRYIWLKNPENLTEGQRVRLSDLEKLNLKINRAYILKEAFRCFWDYTYRRNAEKYLDRWLWWATHSRLEPMRWSCPVSVDTLTRDGGDHQHFGRGDEPQGQGGEPEGLRVQDEPPRVYRRLGCLSPSVSSSPSFPQ